jgi:predicted phosphodiesterase
MPDVVFATGDIAYSGQPDEYEIASVFFDQLLEAASLNRRRLYVVPGNHDVDRALGSQLTRTFYDPDEADRYFAPGARKLHLREKLGSFRDWHDKYFDGIRKTPYDSTCGPVELIEVRGHRLGILPINTALFCQDDGDHDKLWVGRRCLDSALKELEVGGARLKLALMHHPVEFLSFLERQQIRASLVDHLDVILSGHVHEAGVVTVHMSNNRNLYCAAGATYQTRHFPNTAYYGTFHDDQVTIFPIRYEDQPREVWTVDPSLFPNAPRYEMTFPVPRRTDFLGFGAWRGDRHKAHGTVIPGIAAQLPVRKRASKTKRKGSDAKRTRKK